MRSYKPAEELGLLTFSLVQVNDTKRPDNIAHRHVLPAAPHFFLLSQRTLTPAPSFSSSTARTCFSQWWFLFAFWLTTNINLHYSFSVFEVCLTPMLQNHSGQHSVCLVSHMGWKSISDSAPLVDCNGNMSFSCGKEQREVWINTSR